ncbi:MAG: heavy-metal-associated domain-containing protein, partial [Bacteroidota bacterium]
RTNSNRDFMTTYRYETNIHCESCIKAVSGFLNATQINQWSVDIAHPAKVLTVATESLSSDEIKEIVEEAGFDATLLT